MWLSDLLFFVKSCIVRFAVHEVRSWIMLGLSRRSVTATCYYNRKAIGEEGIPNLFY